VGRGGGWDGVGSAVAVPGSRCRSLRSYAGDVERLRIESGEEFLGHLVACQDGRKSARPGIGGLSFGTQNPFHRRRVKFATY